MIQTESKISRSAIHKLIISIWNREQLPEQWRQSIVEPISKKDNKTDYGNYRRL